MRVGLWVAPLAPRVAGTAGTAGNSGKGAGRGGEGVSWGRMRLAVEAGGRLGTVVEAVVDEVVVAVEKVVVAAERAPQCYLSSLWSFGNQKDRSRLEVERRVGEERRAVEACKVGEGCMVEVKEEGDM